MQTTEQQAAGGAAVSDRFRNWAGELNCGFTGLTCRVYVAGEYRLDGRCGGKMLARQVVCDFNPAYFTIHVVDAPGDGGEWVRLAGSFQAPRVVEQVILVEGDERHTFAVDRSMAGAASLAQTGSDDGEEKESIPCPFADTRGWEAWVNRMPGPRSTLIVVGEVEVGSDGYSGRLTLGPVGKSNPPVQFLELSLVEDADGKAGWQEVRAEGPAAYNEYGAAIIDCHGDMLAHIPVRVTE